MITFKNRPVGNLEVDGVDVRDFPDFCDAHFSYAEWLDTGNPLSDSELEKLSEEFYYLVNEMALDDCYAAAEDMYERDP